MKYIYINKTNDNIVGAIVDEIDPIFPDIPINERYSADFLNSCIKVSDESFEKLNIHTGMTYNFETGEFLETEPQPSEGYSISQQEINSAYEGGVEDVE